MKKLFFALLTIAFVGSLCFAQQASAPVSQTAPAATAGRSLTGTVDSVSIGDASQGESSRIVLVDEAGQKVSLRVRESAIIKDKNENIITLDSIHQGQKVTIEYTLGRKGTGIVSSIKVVG